MSGGIRGARFLGKPCHPHPLEHRLDDVFRETEPAEIFPALFEIVAGTKLQEVGHRRLCFSLAVEESVDCH